MTRPPELSAIGESISLLKKLDAIAVGNLSAFQLFSDSIHKSPPMEKTGQRRPSPKCLPKETISASLDLFDVSATGLLARLQITEVPALNFKNRFANETIVASQYPLAMRCFECLFSRNATLPPGCFRHSKRDVLLFKWRR